MQLGWFGPWSVLSRGQTVWPSKSSCTWAQRAGSSHGTVPSALSGSVAMFGTFSHQPDAPTCHPRRGRPASTGHAEAKSSAGRRLWPAVLTPKHAALRARGAVASHRAADGAGPSIEGARTYAHGFPRGAVAVSSAFRSRSRQENMPTSGENDIIAHPNWQHARQSAQLATV